jgi:hypothetical protein
MSDQQAMDDYADGLEVAKEFIPARTRRAVYAAASILGYVLAAAVVGFTVAGVDVPTAVAVALAVLGALVGPIGQLAAANTNTGV